MKLKMGLALRFSFIFLLAVYIPFILMGYFSFDLVNATQKKVGTNFYNRLADLNIKFFEVETKAYLNSLRSVKNSIRLAAMIKIYEKVGAKSVKEIRKNKDFVYWENLFEKLLEQELTSSPDLEGMALFSPEGELILGLDRDNLDRTKLIRREYIKLPDYKMKRLKVVRKRLKDYEGLYHSNLGVFLPIRGDIRGGDHFIYKQIPSHKNKNRRFLLSFNITPSIGEFKELLERKKGVGKRDFYIFKEIHEKSGYHFKGFGNRSDEQININDIIPGLPEGFLKKDRETYIDSKGNIFTIRKFPMILKNSEKLVLINFNPVHIIRKPFEDIRNVTIKVLAICGLFVIPFVWLAFKGIAKNFKEISSELGKSSDRIDFSSDKISQASSELKQSNEESIDNISGITKSMTSLNSLVSQIKKETGLAMDLSNKSSEAAEMGKRELDGLLISMEEIVQASKNIEKIIKIIEEISFQTNILSLNASVEAARAGEHGKGFAVVAESIRSLAEKSAGSASEISNLIADSIERTEIGAEKTFENQVKFKNIIENVDKLNLIIKSISKSVDVEFNEFIILEGELDTISRTIESLNVKSNDYSVVSTTLKDETTSLKGLINKIKDFIKGGEEKSS